VWWWVVVGGGGGGVEGEFSDQLWLWPSRTKSGQQIKLINVSDGLFALVFF
jgi:hypothetical protein